MEVLTAKTIADAKDFERLLQEREGEIAAMVRDALERRRQRSWRYRLRRFVARAMRVRGGQ